jgi:transcriptional regulator with XRE-family HTH domain
MATREKSARNGAAAAYLRTLRAESRRTLQETAVDSGINFETLRRQLNNQAVISLDDFLRIAVALGQTESEALSALAEKVKK